MPATAAVGSGYGESKWVAEALLIEAVARTPLEVVIVRSGQVSGGLNGYWSSSDWFPSMIQSAASVKCLPVTSSERVSAYTRIGVLLWCATADSSHLADGIFCALGRCRKGNRRYARFPGSNPPPRSPISRTVELGHPTNSGHTFRPASLLPRLGLPPRTHRPRQRFDRIS